MLRGVCSKGLPFEGAPDYELVSRYDYAKAYDLARVKRLLLLLGAPQDRYPSVIISGTKGKGSTAAMLASISESAGIKTGLFTSPHLLSVRERIKINGAPITNKDFSNAASSVKKVITRHRLRRLTYFEILAAIAFLYFAEKKIGMAFLEVGLGGRLDATNVVYPLASVITPISRDHTHLLGESVESIAKEKCGIIKRGSCVVSAPQNRAAERIIRAECDRKKAALFFLRKSTYYKALKTSIRGTTFSLKGPPPAYKDLHIPLIGRQQAMNAALALMAVAVLNKRFGYSIKEGHIRRGLRKTNMPGRFQVVSKTPYIILDGAHNIASAKALRLTVLELFGNKIKTGASKLLLILGVSSDKDIEGMGRALCPLADKVIFTRAGQPRSEPPIKLAHRLSRFCEDCYSLPDAAGAVAFANALAEKGDIILITGSFYLIGDVLRIIR